MRFRRTRNTAGLANIYEPGYSNLVRDFGLTGWCWAGDVGSVSREYFRRALSEGISARRRIGDDTGNLSEWSRLLDHGIFWKTEDGSVVFTSQPYSTLPMAEADFEDMKMRCGYPETMRMAALDYDRYRPRRNGDMLLIFYEEDNPGMTEFISLLNEHKDKDK